MGASQSTSSITTNHDNGGKYDVFISFGSEDIRDNFTSHLYDALCRKKIRTFMDYQLKRGDEVSPALLKIIEESIISIVIFSKDYASSRCNLRELAKIMQYKRMGKQIVIPVFYHIDPSDVRKQKGSLNNSFVKHERESPKEVQMWRDALTEASNLSGWHSSVLRLESRLVDEIVKDVLKKLNDVSPWSDYKGLVGIHSRAEEVFQLLRIEMLDFRGVGIWGMGGIGKTIIAGVVFDKISNQFEGCCFVSNVREESQKRGGLICLRDEVLSKLLDEKINLSTSKVPLYIKRRLRTKKILLVLDDVNNVKQLETLAGGVDKFGLGSRVIITTRDKHLLRNCGLHNVYKVDEFNYYEALQLLCKFAFKQDHPPADFMEFSERIINYAKGNPLALKVVGSSLYKKNKQDWESALHKLNKISNLEIHHLLRINYDGLDGEEKDIFLDIACFFKGEYKGSVMQILNGCYFSAQYGLSVLIDKSLVTISNGNIEMHDLIQEMGWEIIRQESPRKPYKRSRLHNHQDICSVLGRNTGTEAIKGILLDMSKMKKMNMNSQAFEKMFNLRFLKLYYGTQCNVNKKKFSNVCLPSDLNYLPDGLRYLRWEGYPSKSLPSSLSLEYLVQLNLSESNVEKLWDGKKDLPKLKWLILGESQHLTRIPDLSHSPSLEVIDFQDCKSLLDISSSIQHLNSLYYLRLKGCESLTSFSSNIYFKSLFTLDLSLCFNLKKFPPLSGKVKMLNLEGTAVEEVPSSIEKLKELSVLNLSSCKQLKHISANICKVKSLRSLQLNGCFKLENFPTSMDKMECLETLDLSGTAIKSLTLKNNHETLPSSISELTENMENSKFMEKLLAGRASVSQVPPSFITNLKELCLNYCHVKEISEGIGCLSSLKELELRGNDFESLPKSFKQLSKLRVLLLGHCNNLQSLTELPLGLETLEAENCKQLQSLPDASNFAEIFTNFLFHGESTFIYLEFMFTNSLKLGQKASNNVLAESLLLAFQSIGTTGKEYKEKVCADIGYPGSELPEWFIYRSSDNFVNVQLPQHDWSNRKFLGFAICAVIKFAEPDYYGSYSRIVHYNCHFKTNCGDGVKHGGSLFISSLQNFKAKIFSDSDHVIIGYRDHSYFKLLRDDYTTCLVEFLPPEDGPISTVIHCGVRPIYAEANIHQLRYSLGKFGTTNHDSSGTMVEELAESMELLDEADMNGGGSSRSDDQEMNPHPKTSPFINSKVILHRISHNKIELLCCNCWIIFVCVFCGFFVFGMLALLVLHLSTLCEIYLSSHAQNMQGKKFQ